MRLSDKIKLQPHQQAAVDHYGKSGGGAIINHGLGSGKTLTSIAIAQKHAPKGKILVVAPASLQKNYKKELEWAVPKGDRSRFNIVSYAKFRKDPHAVLKDVNPEMVIADEVHRARNAGKTRKALEVARAHSPNMLGLTASILNNRPEEGVGLANLVSKKPVLSVEEFKRNHLFNKPVYPGLMGRLRGVKPGFVEVIRWPRALKARLGGSIHRFSGNPEYLSHLPQSTERRVEVEMSDEQERLMKFLEGKNPMLAYKIKKNLPPSKKELSQMNAFMMGMRQVSNSPASHNSNLKNGPSSSPKMTRMVKDVHEMQSKDPNFRAVVYSKFLNSGVRPVVDDLGGNIYEGKVSQNARQEMINDFHAGKNRVLGISPAGGEGIDLKGVKLMSVMEPDWNPETTAQAIGRSVRYKSHAHLPESERKVNVRRYLSTRKKKWYHGKVLKRPVSVDEYIESRAAEKGDLNKRFLDALG